MFPWHRHNYQWSPRFFLTAAPDRKHPRYELSQHRGRETWPGGNFAIQTLKYPRGFPLVFAYSTILRVSFKPSKLQALWVTIYPTKWSSLLYCSSLKARGEAGGLLIYKFGPFSVRVYIFPVLVNPCKSYIPFTSIDTHERHIYLGPIAVPGAHWWTPALSPQPSHLSPEGSPEKMGTPCNASKMMWVRHPCCEIEEREMSHVLWFCC